MKTIITLCIFLSSLLLEYPLRAAALESTAMEAAANHSAIGDKGVSHKSAKRFKAPKRGKVRRGKRTCLKKNGCTNGWAKAHSPEKKRSKCHDKR